MPDQPYGHTTYQLDSFSKCQGFCYTCDWESEPFPYTTIESELDAMANARAACDEHEREPNAQD